MFELGLGVLVSTIIIILIDVNFTDSHSYFAPFLIIAISISYMIFATFMLD